MNLRSISVAAAVLLLSTPATAEDPPKPAPPAPAPESAELEGVRDEAIATGLAYLVKEQHKDGYWLDTIGHKANQDFQGKRGRNVAVTAIAGLAFVRNGSLPGLGPQASAIERAVAWLVAQQREKDGFIGVDGSDNYGHAFAVQFLAEVTARAKTAGLDTPEMLRPALELAVAYLATTQSKRGGWGYGVDFTLKLPSGPYEVEHTPESADLSVTAGCVLALVAARDAGVELPEACLPRAIAYVKQSQLKNPAGRLQGGFYYQILEDPFQRSRTTFTLTAGGVASLVAAGEAESPEVKLGLQFLANPSWTPPAWRLQSSFDYLYGHYYASKAFEADPAHRARWAAATTKEFLEDRRDDGTWEDLVGQNYATAVATLLLQSTQN